MDLNELFRRLSVGELSNLSMALEGGGTIEETQHQKIVLYANEGLKRLYSRFLLKESELLLELYGHITNYHLIKRFAESSYDPQLVDYPYIKDRTREPFLQDVVKVLEVWDSLGCKLPLNDSARRFSLFTPQPEVLQVPHPVPGMLLNVTYQALHVPLSADKLDHEIELPAVLEPALTAFIAYKVFTHTNTQENITVGQGHLTQCETICAEVEEKDLVSTSTTTSNVVFEQRGWA